MRGFMCLGWVVLLGCAAGCSSAGDSAGDGSQGAAGDNSSSATGGGDMGAGGSGGVASSGSSGSVSTTGSGGSKPVGGSGGMTGTGGAGGSASVNGSCAWAPVDAGHLAFYMAAAPHANAVYMFDKDQKQLYVTTNDGAMWTALAKTTSDGKAVDALMLKIIFDPADMTDNTFWAGGIYGASGVYYTKDGGRTFSSTCFAHTQTESVDLTDPARKTILATDHGGAFFMSTDGGKTCMPILDKVKAADAAVSRANVPYIVDTKTFLVSTGGYGGTDGIFRSADGGNTWTKVNASAPSQNLVVGPDGAFFYSLFWNRGLLKSTDKGLTWTQTIGYGTLESGLESTTSTFIGDGRMVHIKMLTKMGPQQLLVSSDFKAFNNFEAPFPTDHMDWPDQSVGVVYSPPANKLYTYTRYGKISRCDL
jgi:hypothetical protein